MISDLLFPKNLEIKGKISQPLFFFYRKYINFLFSDWFTLDWNKYSQKIKSFVILVK